jgi:pyruvate dehydrogenase E1 component alpha subunit
VAVVFFGDGAMAEGVLHESLNLAALWKLPFFAVCENNGWAEFSPTSRQVVPKLADLSKAYGIPHQEIDGNDIEEVWVSADRAISNMRSGGGPYVLECRTTRVRGHFEGDQQKYREPIAATAPTDAVVRARKRLIESGVTDAELDAVEARIELQIDHAVEVARSGNVPDFQRASRGVYAMGRS